MGKGGERGKGKGEGRGVGDLGIEYLIWFGFGFYLYLLHFDLVQPRWVLGASVCVGRGLPIVTRLLLCPCVSCCWEKRARKVSLYFLCF